MLQSVALQHVAFQEADRGRFTPHAVASYRRLDLLAKVVPPQGSHMWIFTRQELEFLASLKTDWGRLYRSELARLEHNRTTTPTINRWRISHASDLSTHCCADAYGDDRYWRFISTGCGMFLRFMRFKL